MKTLDEILDYIKEQFLDSSKFGGAWFKSDEEFENWAGDMLQEAVEYTLRCVGIRVDYEGDEGILVEMESDEEDSESYFNEDMGFDPYMGCYTDDC